MTRRYVLGAGVIALMVVLGIALSACGLGNSDDDRVLVPLDALLASPQQYTGQYLCTEGAQVDGFEASGLAASTSGKDSNLHLTEPVIWLEGADLQSREDCIRGGTNSAFEFCQVVVCGVFETGGRYGHGGAYAHQLRGGDVSALPTSTTAPEVLPTLATDDKTSTTPEEGEARQGSITIEAVQVTSGEQVLVLGQSTLPNGTCLGSELWADGELEAWWPGDACVPVENSAWQMVVRLGSNQVPPELDPSAQYMLRVYQENGPNIVSVFAFSVASLPVLTVDESPIVDAEADGPGHFEYTDRLGEQILARIKGLRAYAAEQQLAHTKADLTPFGYRLEAYHDAEWNQTFYDLYRLGEAEPVLAGLPHVWPVSVNASGTDFVLVAENAPNVFPLYLMVQVGSVEPWGDAEQSNWLPPAYVGDALARVTYTGFPTITYQVELDDGRPGPDGSAIYSGTAIALGAYMPLRSFTTWDDHWVLEVDDHIIWDGKDIGQVLGYDAAFGFNLIEGQPFYFFEQEGKVRISYGGRTLPFVYDQVFHDQCCEAAIHNVESLGDVVLFHALWNGTWYFVEAGVYDGEMAGTYRYTAPEGWSFHYPMHWDLLDEELGFVQDTATGKTVTFASQPTTEAELERWIESEIARKLAATEAKNSLAEPLSMQQEGALTAYRYAILSRSEASETLLRTTVLFDGERRYEFHAAIPPVAEEEYAAIVASFQPTDK